MHEPVGLRAIDEDRWIVHYGSLEIGLLDEHIGKVAPLLPGDKYTISGGSARLRFDDVATRVRPPKV